MSSEVTAVATLVVTFLLAILIDRGVANILESIAWAVERSAESVVELLRRSAVLLRRRHRAIELAHQERLAGTRMQAVDPAVNSRPSAAAF